MAVMWISKPNWRSVVDVPLLLTCDVPKVYGVVERGASTISESIAVLSNKFINGDVGLSVADTGSHILFAFSNGIGFESHMKSGGFYPVEIKTLLDKFHRESLGKKAWHFEVELPYAGAVRKLYEDCIRDVGQHDYDAHLIWRIGLASTLPRAFNLHRRLGRHLIPRTPGNRDCSESFCRRLALWIDYRKETKRWTGTDQKYDAITPAMIQALYLLRDEIKSGYPPLPETLHP